MVGDKIKLSETSMTKEDRLFVHNCTCISYLLMTIANDFYENAADKLKENGLVMHELKHNLKGVNEAFDKYLRYMDKDFVSGGSDSLVRDFENLRSMIEQFVLLPKDNWDWKHKYLFECVQHNNTKKLLSKYE